MRWRLMRWPVKVCRGLLDQSDHPFDHDAAGRSDRHSFVYDHQLATAGDRCLAVQQLSGHDPTDCGLGLFYLCIDRIYGGNSKELEEAARIDGASEWQIFFHVILPLVKPALGTVVTFGFIMIWDQYLLPLIVVNQDSLNTIPVILGTLRTDESITPNIFIAITLLAMLPSIIVYLGLQNISIAGSCLARLKAREKENGIGCT